MTNNFDSTDNPSEKYQKQPNLGNYILDKISSAPPNKTCFIDNKNKTYSYQDALSTIRQFSDQICKVVPSDQVICLAPQGFELLCLLIACFSLHKTIVFIDPQIGIRRFYNIILQHKNTPVLVTSYSFLHRIILKILFPYMKFINIYRTFSVSADTITPSTDTHQTSLKINTSNTEAIDGFTSGTTGEVKQLRRHHRHLIAAAEIFNNNFFQIKNDVHLIGYTLSGIRNFIDLGTAVEKPERAKLLNAFSKLNINRVSGPPSLFDQIIEISKKKSVIHTNVLNAVIGGAPMQKWLASDLRSYFPNATIQQVYGSTECEPICICSIEKILEYKGLGYYVGKPVENLNCTYIPIQNNLYELCVEGKQVITDSRHNTKDVVRKLDDDSLVIAGRKDYLVTNTKGEIFGQYEIETLIENEFSNIKKAAVIQENSLLKVFIEPFHKNLKIDTTAIIKLIKAHDFKNIQVKVVNLPYDTRHLWKVVYRKLPV